MEDELAFGWFSALKDSDWEYMVYWCDFSDVAWSVAAMTYQETYTF